MNSNFEETRRQTHDLLDRKLARKALVSLEAGPGERSCTRTNGPGG